MKKKKKKKNQARQKQKSISYVCASCGIKEDITIDVLEYFDETNPEQFLFGSHRFTCENCKAGVMAPEKEPEIMIRGYGLHKNINQD